MRKLALLVCLSTAAISAGSITCPRTCEPWNEDAANLFTYAPTIPSTLDFLPTVECADPWCLSRMPFRPDPGEPEPPPVVVTIDCPPPFPPPVVPPPPPVAETPEGSAAIMAGLGLALIAVRRLVR